MPEPIRPQPRTPTFLIFMTTPILHGIRHSVVSIRHSMIHSVLNAECRMLNAECIGKSSEFYTAYENPAAGDSAGPRVVSERHVQRHHFSAAPDFSHGATRRNADDHRHDRRKRG